MASRRLTKTTFAALKSARHNKLSLAQSGSRAKSISTFTNFTNSLSRPPIENKLILPPNDVVSAKLSFTTVSFARKFHSSTPLRSSATGISQITPTEFTEKAWEGIVGAVDAARVNNQQVVETEHLMKALLEQKDGLARRILTKAGQDNTKVLQATEDFISKQPKVTGATSGPIVGSNFGLLLSNAQRIKKEMEDDFVSVEHLLLAFLSDDRFGRLLFNDIRLNEKDLKDAVKAVRGHQRVTDQKAT